MSKEYIEVEILDVMRVMEGSYPDANQRWEELKNLITLQRTHKTMKSVKDRYFPNRSLDELEGKVQKT